MNIRLLIALVWVVSCSPPNPASEYLKNPKPHAQGAEAKPETKNQEPETGDKEDPAGDKEQEKPVSDNPEVTPPKMDPVVTDPVKMPDTMMPPPDDTMPPAKLIKFEGKLRIMPLGASFTQGVGSKKAGYRGFLHKFLDEAKIPHQFVGLNKAQPGDLPMDQISHEGHPGSVITAGTSGRAGITDNLAKWLGPQGTDPQIFTILVGSNDVDINYKFDEVEARYDNMISMLIDPVKGLKPNAIVIVSTISLFGDMAKEARRTKYNDIIKKIAERRKAKGERVYFIDTAAKLVKSDLVDSLHANDVGYEKVGRLWADKIKEAIAIENAKK